MVPVIHPITPAQENKVHIPPRSALPGYTVQQVRRGLDALRAARRDGSLVLTNPFMYGMTAVEFSTRVAVGQHMKRQDKRLRQKLAERRRTRPA
jgi:hypothetical protein